MFHEKSIEVPIVLKHKPDHDQLFELHSSSSVAIDKKQSNSNGNAFGRNGNSNGKQRKQHKCIHGSKSQAEDVGGQSASPARTLQQGIKDVGSQSASPGEMG